MVIMGFWGIQFSVEPIYNAAPFTEMFVGSQPTKELVIST